MLHNHSSVIQGYCNRPRSNCSTKRLSLLCCLPEKKDQYGYHCVTCWSCVILVVTWWTIKEFLLWLHMTMPRDQITAASKIWCFSHLGDPHRCVIIKCNVKYGSCWNKLLYNQLSVLIIWSNTDMYVHIELWLGGCSPAPTGGGGKENWRTSSETCNIGCTVTVTYIKWCNDWSLQ
jgi:hypothetical protein